MPGEAQCKEPQLYREEMESKPDHETCLLRADYVPGIGGPWDPKGASLCLLGEDPLVANTDIEYMTKYSCGVSCKGEISVAESMVEALS